jgi:hypothetical protein
LLPPSGGGIPASPTGCLGCCAAPTVFGRGGFSGAYKVTQLLEGGDFQYRIKSASEPHERVVKESDLDRAA